MAEPMPETRAGQSFTGRLIRSWRDPRGVMRGVLDTRPEESRILMFAMTSGMILLLAESLSLVMRASRVGGSERIAVAFAAAFTALLILRPLFLYILAAVIGLAARALGGAGSWRETRAAVAWAAVAAAPISVLGRAVEEALISGGIGWLSVSAVGNAAFAVMLAYCVAEAHRFEKVWPTLVVIGGLTMAIWGMIYAA